MLLGTLGLSAQYNVSVSGTVSTPSGDPVENVEITLLTDSLGGFFYYNTFQTATDGTYSDSFDSPVTQGGYTLIMENCNNNYEYVTQFYNPGNYDAIVDFTYCENGIDTCSVSIQNTPVGALAAIPSGAGPYTYVWNTGETTANIFPNQDGTYCVTITSANGCSASSCYTVISGGQDSCWVEIFETATGELTADAFGVAPYLYQWSDGSTTQTITPNIPDTLYCVTVTDAVGCVAVNCFDLWDNCSVFIDIVSQGNTAVDLQAFASGTAPFVYNWSTGETSATISVTESGTYCVDVTDASGCVATFCFTVFLGGGQDSCWVDIFQSPNGPITADASGVAPFTYAWSTGETTQTIFPQGDTLYCVTVTDAVGCVAFSCIDLWDNPVDTTACFVNIVCPPGGGSLLASGFGAEPITYVWSTGETTAEISPTETGEYCVTMTDSEGCTASACVWHYEGGGGQDSCSVFIDIVSQGTSSVDLQAFTQGAVSFLWNTGETTSTITVTETGIYCVTVTDTIGLSCTDCLYYSSPSNYNIGGTIYLQDSLQQAFLSGWVYLYEFTAFGTELVDSIEFESTPNGWTNYLFQNVPEGEYIVKGELNPDSDGYDEHAPTYHFSTTWWNEANVITIPNAGFGYSEHIVFVETDGFGGGEGEVNGIVQQLDGWVVNEDPMPNVSVMIMDEFENLLGHVKTDAQGRFKFEGLDWGTYKVGIEITGLPQVFYLVTLSPDNPTVANITFDVNNDEITVTETLDIILTESGFEIMPNPVSDNLNIQLDLREANNLQIQLMHVSGQVLRQESLNLGIGQQNIEWNVANLPSGIYFINLKKDQDVISKKFIKK